MKTKTKEAVIIDACRSPIGRAGDRGVFRSIGFIDMMAPVFKTIIERNKLDPKLIDDVCIGSAGTVGGAMTRNIILTLGLPQSIAGCDTARQCASSSNAVANAAHYIINDDADIVIAGGLETMDRRGPVQPWQIGSRGAPGGGPRPAAPGAPPGAEEARYPPDWKFAAKLLPVLPPEIPPWIYDMGMTAEELCRRYGITRQECDAFSLTSHQKAVAAQDQDIFKDEIVPIKLEYTDGTSEIIGKDQLPRRETSLERLSTLPPAYRQDGLITAGNSCPRSDGAGAVLMMSKEKAKELGYKPMMTFRHAVSIGVDPTVMGIGPVPSTKKLLERTGMKIQDFDIFEVNEAFACVVLYWIRELGCGPKEIAKVNPYGGAIAIGHPLGMTGTRQTAVIARSLNRTGGRFGLATLCVGGGQGMATMFEREDYS
ncbi:MAG: thiolase family protein [Dehalococcoidia bacterium]|nr:thiolase family protein [Dehalococcoidia bacterium]